MIGGVLPSLDVIGLTLVVFKFCLLACSFLLALETESNPLGWLKVSARAESTIACCSAW
jgi:hypothetical protein